MKKEVYSSIIKASGIEKGDLVLVQYWMQETFSEDIAFLQAEIAKAGATPVMVVQNINVSQAINENVTEFTYGDKFFSLYENADVVIDLIERPIGVLSAPLAPEKMGILGDYMQRLFKTCATKKKMLQLRVPTKAMANSFGMEEKEFADRLEAAMNIEYETLKSECEKLVNEYSNKNMVEILTNDGVCKLSLCLEGRNWDVDAGDGDIPCGEVSIAPVEERTNGEVYFEKVYIPNPFENGKLKRFENITISIENGVVKYSNNDELNRIFDEFGKENSTVCELGIGMNPGVTSLCGCPLLDEKMIGTFHLGFGDNTMFGGTNEADEHYDFVGQGSVKLY